MKLRQHKREHLNRLRRRIRLVPWLARIEALVDREHERLMDDCWTKRLQGTGVKLFINDEQAVGVSFNAPGGPVRSPEEISEAIASVIALAGDELRIEAGANGAPVVHADGSKVSAAALIAMAEELTIGSRSASGTLQVAMTAEQRERALRVIEKVWRDDPRRFTFHPKLPRR